MPHSTGRRKVQSGTGSGRAGVGGMISVDTAAGASLLAAETTIATLTIKANTFYKNGQVVRVTARFRTAANGNNKLVKLYVGAAEVFSTGAIAANAAGGFVKADICRTAEDVQKVSAYGRIASSAGDVTNTTLANNDAADIPVLVKATAASADADVVHDFSFAEVLAS